MAKENKRPDFDVYRESLDIKVNKSTYVEAMKFKARIEKMKKELADLHKIKIDQERIAEDLKAKYLKEWNQYLEMAKNEDNKRQEIIRFVIGDEE